jgi:hypothetical protein
MMGPTNVRLELEEPERLQLGPYGARGLARPSTIVGLFGRFSRNLKSRDILDAPDALSIICLALDDLVFFGVI